MDLRRCLNELPETLDETYERILLDIPRDDWEHARKALLWICAHDELPFMVGIPTTCLILAVFSLESTEVSVGLNAYDFSALQEICGCLIRSSEYSSYDASFESISLAHYTVKEFLQSKRIERTATMYFSLSKASSICQYPGDVLQTCISLELKVEPGHFFDSLQDCCREIARFAPKYWGKILFEDDKLFGLQIQYMESPHFTVDLRYIPIYPQIISCYHEDICFYDRASRLSASWKGYILLSLLQRDHFDLCNKLLDGLGFKSLLYAPLEIFVSSDECRKICGNILEIIRYDTLQEDKAEISWNAHHHSFLLEQCQGRLNPAIRTSGYLFSTMERE